MIRKAGYPVEAHVIMTEDGYLLTLHRISAYLLADQGYNVWLGNFHGTTYSKTHISLSPSNPTFWNFSFDEIGIYDVSAMVTFITNLRSQPLHTCVGHSMGTTCFYVMASERPEIARMVKMMFNFGPVFLNHMQSPIRFLVPIRRMIKTLQPIILSDFLDVVSVKAMEHYVQEIHSGKFRKYDYGRARNQLIYNSAEPPDYNLANITVPSALFYGSGDLLVNIFDVKRLYRILPNVVDLYEVPWSKFNHLDFIWAKDAPKLVYERAFKLMKNTNLNNVILIG
ncbi:lipase 1-like [Camponotus floridanus]|uniref:lipase 1-like n=1 Tax=Camponotus floridanus TaxID=104421 RepID=UPI000DC699B8|nr:lipase 1-like [Camponotus floridanus]